MAFTTINDPSAYFQIAKYTGNGSTQSIVNGGNSNLQPDFIWIKDMGSAFDHKLSDSTRGSTYTLEANTDTAAYNDTNAVTSFNTDGFSLGNNANVNDNTANVVAWQWKANGGTTAANGNGSISSTVQASTTAGFSIVKWTGSGANATIGHGLGAIPQVIIFKNYDNTDNWVVYHHRLGNDGGLYLNLGNALNSASSWFNDTTPTSTVFSIGTNSKTNSNGNPMIAYCFSNIKGYSKMDSYKGNGDVDGPFIFTGFKPSFILTKRTDNTGSWLIHDIKRNGYNSNNDEIEVNTNAAQANNDRLDILSNGFKIRNTAGYVNADGANYVYLALADSPLVASNNVAATTRGMG